MLILIGIFIGSFCLTFSACMLIWRFWCRRREQRYNIVYANRSIDDLFIDATIYSPYQYDYYKLCMCMSGDKARKIIVQRYLISRGLIGYRKERIEL